MPVWDLVVRSLQLFLEVYHVTLYQTEKQM